MNQLPGQPKPPLWGSVAVVGVAALLLSVWFVGPPIGTAAKLENRPMTPLPEITLQSLLKAETYAGIEAWLKDRVRIKPLLVTVVNSAADRVNAEAGTAKVIKGARLHRNRGNELFAAVEFTDRCWDRPNYSVYVNELRSLRSAAKQGHKQLYIIITPSKHRVLGRLLGGRRTELEICARHDDAVIKRLARQFSDILKVVSPKRVLQLAPNNPYFEGDTHWTPRAGVALSELVVSRLTGITRHRADLILWSRLHELGYRELGALYAMSGIDKVTRAPFLNPKHVFAPQVRPYPSTLPAEGEQDPQGPVLEWFSPHPLPTAPQSMMIVHDSFVNMPGLTRQFAPMVATGFDVHWHKAEDLAKLPPVETVIVENIDRTFLHRLTFDTQAEDLSQVDTMKLLREYLRRTS